MTTPLGEVRSVLIHWLLACSVLLFPPLRGAETPAAPTDAEYTAFGENLAELFATGKAQQAVNLLDQARFMARVTDGLGLSQENELGFKQGLLKNLSVGLTQQFGAFTQARFLRLQKVQGETRALIRLVSDDGASSYTAFICVRDRTGALRWIDAYLYIAGSTLAETMRNTALPLVAEMNKGVIAKLTTKESAFAANFGKIQQAAIALRKGENLAAWAIYEKLPKEVQLNRTVLILRLRAAQPLDEAKYLAVIQDWQAAYPNDSTLDFISIDGAILRKDYPAALKHISNFGKQIGGDVYLDYLSGNVLLLADKLDEARVVTRKALTEEPSLFAAYDTLLTISLKAKNYSETIATLEEFHRRFPSVDVQGEMVSGEEFAAFRSSPEFLAWKEKKPAAATPLRK